MRPNRLRELISADEPSVGTHVMSSWPNVVEMAGRAGCIDYVEFVAEYAPYDLYALENFGRTVELFSHMTSMIKVEQGARTYLAPRAIGAGIQNVLFADIRSVEDVEECVASVRADTPQTGGTYGASDRRIAGFREGDSPAYVQALEEVVVALMIEKDDAVKDLERLLAVKGVDMVQFGASDYSMSIGKPGQASDPGIQEVQNHVIKTALKMGVEPRAELMAPDQAERFLDLGVKHFSIGTDLTVLYLWWMENGEALRKIIGSR